MIVDADSKFLTRGYEAAAAAKKERVGKGKDAYGSKTHQATNIKEVCSQILKNILDVQNNLQLEGNSKVWCYRKTPKIMYQEGTRMVKD